MIKIYHDGRGPSTHGVDFFSNPFEFLVQGLLGLEAGPEIVPRMVTAKNFGPY